MAESIALVGSETLLGREVLDQMKESRLGFEVRLIATPDEEAGRLTEAAGDPAITLKLEPAAFDGVSVAILACSPAIAKQVAEFHLPLVLIDLSYALDDAPNARLRAPLVEPHDFRVAPDATQVIAHPAAIAIALVLGRIHPVFPISRSVIHVFEPASERGSPGIEELQQQTVSLLSFKPLPKQIFDTQLSYAMLAGLGEQAPVSLADVESRIERHTASLLGNLGGAPVPSLRLIQAPVFHGYSFSLWIEFESNPGVTALEQVLSEAPIDLRTASSEPPNNVGIAGQSGVAIGAMAVDHNRPQAVWVWMAADNLRLTAENAVLVAKELI